MSWIDAELRRALSVSPSPEFLARVRAQAAEPRGGRVALWWLAPATVAAAAMLVVVLQFRGKAPSTPAVIAVDATAPRTSVPALLTDHTSARHQAPGTRHPAAGTGHEALARTRHQAPGTRHPLVPEVLVPRDEAIALEQLIAGLARGQLDTTAWLSDTADFHPSARITIAPIEIKPLTPER